MKDIIILKWDSLSSKHRVDIIWLDAFNISANPSRLSGL